jgi:Rrf2 family transcriptional regulator, iron-sulfur cluster assembly transcription factor
LEPRLVDGAVENSLDTMQENAMRLSTRSRLAVNTMVDLALRQRAGPVALGAIADRQRVSLSCLAHVLAQLRTAGLVERTRGPAGGYTLARKAEYISVAAILVAVDSAKPRANEEDGRLGLANALSQRLDAMMHTHMAGIALSDLVAGQRAAGAVVEVRPRRAAVVARPPCSPAGSEAPQAA